MNSNIEKYLRSKYSAVAIYRTKDLPEGAEPLGGHCIVDGMLFPAAT